MTHADDTWTVEAITISDILAFQGEHTFEFSPGIQVIEAANHSGKTSLTLGLLWALTGRKPDLPRLDLRSFRLTNKHSGENANPYVHVNLSTRGGRSLRITRRFSGSWSSSGDDELTVLRDGDEYIGLDGDETITQELGLSAESLRGCGVVLQEHRLKLVTGGERELSDVINDMLGLTTLSEMVPLLQDVGKEAARTSKDIDSYLEERNPLTLWEEKQEELEKSWQKRERQALEAGFSTEDLDDPTSSVAKHIAEIAGRLEVDAPEKQERPEVFVDALRKALAQKRREGPRASNLAKLLAEKEQVDQFHSEAERLVDEWTDHYESLAAESVRGTLDKSELTARIADADKALNENEARRLEIREEEEFLNAAYDHLLQVDNVDECPLCGSEDIESVQLIQSVKDRIDSRLASELERLKVLDKDEAERKEKAQSRLEVLQGLETTHNDLFQGSKRLIERLSEFGIRSSDG